MRRFAVVVVVAMVWSLAMLSPPVLAQDESPPPLVDFSASTTTVLANGNIRINNIQLNLPDLDGSFWATFAFNLETASWRLADFGPWVGSDEGGPNDTYFSLVVTENSHNHAGDNLLFLDFDGDTPSANTVVSRRVSNNSIRLDGNLADWDASLLSTVRGRPMDNLPFGEAFDAINTDITVGSAYDDEFIYFVVSWVDANGDRSDRRNEWQFDGTSWSNKRHVAVAEGSRNDTQGVINRDAPVGKESEDRVFLLFPIVDSEKNFTDGGLGCGAYCHADLHDVASGEEEPRMGTNVEGDTADSWHWKANRTAPMGFADDKFFSFAERGDNGRHGDAGRGASTANSASGDEYAGGSGPAFMPIGGGSAQVLFDAAKAEFDQSLYSAGDVLAAIVSRSPQGSRGDILAADSFDAETSVWTVELKRKLFTGNSDDHQFTEGSDASPPTGEVINFGNADTGAMLFADKCAGCHGASGEGDFAPPVQRTVSAQIQRAVAYVPEMSGVEVTRQQTEDIAAWLQTQFTPRAAE